MKRTEIYFKILAVLLIIALSTVSYGATLLERLAADGEDRMRRADAEEYADVKNANSIIGDCKNAIKHEKTEEMPLLVDGIKYKCISTNETLVYFNSNQKMVYSLPLGVCVFYSYDCTIGRQRFTAKECSERVEKCIYTVFRNFRSTKIISIELASDGNGICAFDVKTNLTGDKKIRVSVRKDTGSIVLFDSRGVEITE